MRTAVLVLCLCACHAAQAQSQPVAVSSPALRSLVDLQLTVRDSRTVAGFWLLGFGLASVAAGAAVAAVGHQQHALLAGGLTTASFGAVNAALSFGLLDLSGSQLQRIVRPRGPRAFVAEREAELVRHLKSGQFFALNAGLDVFYLASGALLCAIAAVRDQPDRWELGTGVAVIGQGLFLLAFDVVNWLNSNERAARFRALR